MSTVTETDHLDNLTDAQRDAVMHNTGPALVVAGAGSGKTRVITRRIVHLLRSGVKSSRILGLTFTNKAAGEMRERVEHAVPESKVWLGTFHSFAARILRQNCQRLNVNKDFVICDEDDRGRLIKECLRALGMEANKENTKAASDAISTCKNSLVHSGQYAATARRPEFAFRLVYQRYQWALRRLGQLDFDDLLNLLVVALRQDEELRARLDDQYRYILSDEAQDTNDPQYAILRLLTRDFDNVMIVGDPDQLLYSWRGANINNIMGFQDDYPGCKLIKLENNYRSTPEILRIADALIRHNRNRIEKVLIPTRDSGPLPQLVTHKVPASEAKWIAEDIEFSVSKGANYADHAVLIRVHRLSWDVEQSLLARNIPYKVHGGLGFLGRAEVKDILAYCRLAAFPGDLPAFVRVVNEPNRGAGKVTLDKILAWAADHATTPLAACRQAARIPGVRGRATEELTKFALVMEELGQMIDRPADLVETACEKSGYRAMLMADESEKAAERLDMLDRLCQLARQFATDHPEGTLTDLLERLALDGEDEESAETEGRDRVNIMTYHAAKGLEFPVVYLPGLENGVLPGNKSIEAGGDEMEEERRVLFVGMTRAMDRLVMSHNILRIENKRPERCLPSMFLYEIPRGSVEYITNRGE